MNIMLGMRVAPALLWLPIVQHDGRVIVYLLDLARRSSVVGW
jgi:hypothetical protein